MHVFNLHIVSCVVTLQIVSKRFRLIDYGIFWSFRLLILLCRKHVPCVLMKQCNAVVEVPCLTLRNSIIGFFYLFLWFIFFLGGGDSTTFRYNYYTILILLFYKNHNSCHFFPVPAVTLLFITMIRLLDIASPSVDNPT